MGYKRVCRCTQCSYILCFWYSNMWLLAFTLNWYIPRVVTEMRLLSDRNICRVLGFASAHVSKTGAILLWIFYFTVHKGIQAECKRHCLQAYILVSRPIWDMHAWVNSRTDCNDQWRIQKFWKGGGRNNLSAPSWFIANTYNEIYALYTEKRLFGENMSQ